MGISPDAETFTKAQPMSAVGPGAMVGVHPGSQWNNPEPEIVLAINSRGEVLGATLGNGVNLRDFEGRTALWSGKAKDNNASCAVGPFIRLFDAHFGIDDVRQCDLSLQVQGPEGFVMQGSSSLSQISHDPLDLVDQAMGFTHVVGVSTPKLGALTNTITTSDQASPWVYSISALMRDLARRGLLA